MPDSTSEIWDGYEVIPQPMNVRVKAIEALETSKGKADVALLFACCLHNPFNGFIGANSPEIPQANPYIGTHKGIFGTKDMC